MWLPMNATPGRRDMIKALCSGMLQRKLIEQAATAFALVSSDECLFNAVATDCID